ncbi:MAG: alpha/beta hydrolase [Clostridia bacterium]|jgi:pimeloyl-ACP methyl ester carboxylesterase|nr:alpha/beta hydrolase [Clostridia bacterium]MDD3093351.1 alpha/beta hydrolase [Clostridia bacterium]MDD3963113.1 alpha/beta hydrolase [Synergistaceae bacterium]MDD4543631.1 alpha/beta hydrolase [Clostridia bacterium]
MDISLNFIEKGTGDILILLHGNGESNKYFIHQIDFFSSRYKVIAIDTRGHGESLRGDAPFTLDQFAEDLHNFMLEQKIRKANILGFSDGGNIALLFALKYPDHVSKLILNGANLNPEGVKRFYQLPIILAYKLLVKIADRNPKAIKNAEMLGLMVNEPNIDPDCLKNLSIPTLVIAGTNDMIKQEHTKLIASKIPNAKLVFIKGTHIIAYQKPSEFNKAVNLFLQE